MDSYQVEIVKPQEFEGIELYVSADGQESGMSVRGLSKFIGVSPSTLMERILPKLELGVFASEAPESLKPFVGEAFTRSLQGENGAKIINSRTCEGIIYYYAYESTRVGEDVRRQSRLAHRRFAQIGLHKWICDVVGVIEKRDDRQLLAMMQLVLSEVKELKQISNEYKAIREKTTTHMPGADALLEELGRDNLLQPCEDGAMSLEAWLFSKGVTLDKPRFYRLAQIVADTFRSLAKKDPERRKFVLNGKAKYKVSVYQPEHFPILQIALNKLLSDC